MDSRIVKLQEYKKTQRKIIMLTAYDFPTAQMLDEAGEDIVLVGDSLANVVLGLSSTQDVGMTEMIHHTKAARRGVKNALLLGDMPYESYQVSGTDPVTNAKRFMTEAGCDAVKLEWFDNCVSVAKNIVKAGIPTMGHVGLTPQTAAQLGGMKVQGKDSHRAKEIFDQALALQDAGCFAIVLECIPAPLADLITQKLTIPTIGIGAGAGCDGQVLVIHDVIGLSIGHRPKFAKTYVDSKSNMLGAVKQFMTEVQKKTYPDEMHSFHMPEDQLQELKKMIE